MWPAVPILFRLINPERAALMLDQLAGAEISSDWGARMLTNTSKLYDPISYNNGAIWPFLTGLLSWAEFRNHRAASGFAHWTQNARLTTLNALGFVPELLSGDFYAPMDTAVPHQLFSSSGVLTPLVLARLDLKANQPQAAQQSVERALARAGRLGGPFSLWKKTRKSPSLPARALTPSAFPLEWSTGQL